MNFVQKRMRANQSQWHDLNTFDNTVCDSAIAVKKKSFQMLQLSVEEGTENNALQKNATLSPLTVWATTAVACDWIPKEQTEKAVFSSQTEILFLM